ncbi:hypothetical protein DFW101_3518 [Solidesulfovibrio carbinoliphilus subsp. oakridgensis]|uniref:Uncharacterized protein n=1 Tax=Solidesulfovibrio carbinoliphilus subsp. oakridgensis TaxID=694327 RepID=G7QC68_9BACT|nr:hypothetical protein [Solidesulfovibrio carbinoliphilus]EHJ49514.1 hypothetical protein DFW101_3518 [Solidesulfovibrio carbinoliphilus subsp. oakridgensis]
MAAKSKEELLNIAIGMLRDIEWAGQDRDGDAECLFCPSMRDYDETHGDDCKWKLFF